jgi:hypothetical protein
MRTKEFWEALTIIQKVKFRCKVKIVLWAMNERLPWCVMHEHHIIFRSESDLECKAWANFHRMEY